MMEIKRACEISQDIRPEVSRAFVDGFYQWLSYFSKDKEKLTGAFAHIFNFDTFYVAMIDGEVAGMAACTDGKTPSVRLDKREFRRHLGLFMGSIAYRILKKEFEEKQYPFAISNGMGMVEFVATSQAHRGQGVATAILSHIHESTSYTQYALEVADTNTKAVNLYKKLGYREFQRVKERHSKRSGLNFYLYMKYEKDAKGGPGDESGG